jgi:hypothetical protein
MAGNRNARPTSGRKLSQREIRACAYHIVDLVDTRALQLRRADPALSDVQAFHLALAQLAGE